jgi:hypothetical protein
MNNKVIYDVMCTKQTKKHGVMLKDSFIISLKPINVMVLTPASG